MTVDQPWPTIPTPTEAPADQFTNPEEPTSFSVLVEDLRGTREGWLWRSHILSIHPRRDEARVIAEQTARQYAAGNDLMSERHIWRINPDEYLVIGAGPAGESDYRITVGEQLRG